MGDAKDQCQSREHIESTKSLYTFQMETCNSQKSCPEMKVDNKNKPIYEILRACPQCGSATNTQLKRLQCHGPRKPANLTGWVNDWENEDDYLNEDCRSAKVWNGFDHSEFVETPCSEVVENYAECPAGMGTHCSADGKKTIVA